MSARVLNPSLLSEFCRMRSPVRSAARAVGGAAASPSRPALAKVKRDLFGPVEKDEFRTFFDTEISKHQQRASDRWGFNFARGHPLNDHQQYMWERVPPTGVQPPAMYTLSHAAHVRPSTSTASNSRQHHPASALLGYDDLLLDERAERANAESTRQSTAQRLNSSIGTDGSEYDEDTDEDRLNSSADSLLSGTSPNTSARIAEAANVAKTCRLSLVITATASTASPQQRRASASSSSISKPMLRASTRQQRQPRITDYLKERKRLSATPKKVSPSKRTRLNTSLSRVA